MYEYTLMVFRFIRMDLEEHTKNIEINRHTKEDISKLGMDELGSYIEDRFCVNMILLPRLNANVACYVMGCWYISM
jgi:hypothetical protein